MIRFTSRYVTNMRVVDVQLLEAAIDPSQALYSEFKLLLDDLRKELENGEAGPIQVKLIADTVVHIPMESDVSVKRRKDGAGGCTASTAR